MSYIYTRDASEVCASVFVLDGVTAVDVSTFCFPTTEKPTGLPTRVAVVTRSGDEIAAARGRGIMGECPSLAFGFFETSRYELDRLVPGDAITGIKLVWRGEALSLGVDVSRTRER